MALSSPSIGRHDKAAGLKQDDPGFRRVQHADLQAFLEPGHQPVTFVGRACRAQLPVRPAEKAVRSKVGGDTVTKSRRLRDMAVSSGSARVLCTTSHATKGRALICRKLPQAASRTALGRPVRP
jgi:hypothetical protein